MKFTKQELGYIYKLVIEDIDRIKIKRIYPIKYAEIAQELELKLSEKCRQLR